MARNKPKDILEGVIDQWISETQEGGDPIDMWVSTDLASRMADAAWAVLDESRQTQEWLIKEGYMKRAT